MGGVGGGIRPAGGLLRVIRVIDAQSGNSCSLVCQTTPKATEVSGHVSPGGRGTEAPVLAAIISPNGRLPVVHCGGSSSQTSPVLPALHHNAVALVIVDCQCGMLEVEESGLEQMGTA